MPKINALPPMTTAADDDVLAVDDVSASNATKKLTLTKLKEWLQSLVGWITTAMIGDLQITYGKFASGTIINGEFIRIYKNATQAIAATTSTIIQYNAATAGYSSSLFELNSYGVKILSSRIKSVSVNINAQISNTHVYILYVYKNSALIAALATPASDSAQVSEILFNVSQNDIITARIYDLTGSTNITSAGDWNFMTVAVSAVNA